MAMAMTCGLEDTSVYYFFSTCAQAVAATTSLSGAMLIFRYQSLYQLVAEGAVAVATEFKRSAVSRFVPWEGNDQRDFGRYTTFIGKTNILRRYFDTEFAAVRRKQFTERFEAAKADSTALLGEFETMRHLFSQYDVRVKAASRLRRLTIICTVLGLCLVLSGSLLVLSPSVREALPPICESWYGYVAVLACYFLFAVYVTAVAFTNPHKER